MCYFPLPVFVCIPARHPAHLWCDPPQSALPPHLLDIRPVPCVFSSLLAPSLLSCFLRPLLSPVFLHLSPPALPPLIRSLCIIAQSSFQCVVLSDLHPCDILISTLFFGLYLVSHFFSLPCFVGSLFACLLFRIIGFRILDSAIFKTRF